MSEEVGVGGEGGCLGDRRPWAGGEGLVGGWGVGGRWGSGGTVGSLGIELLGSVGVETGAVLRKGGGGKVATGWVSERIENSCLLC